MLPKYNESGASMTPIRSTQVLYHHGFEDVQLKVSVAASDGDGHVVPITWAATMVMASHWVGFTLPAHSV